MNGPIFNGGEEFLRLWAELPKIITYQDYIDMCNEIDTAMTSHLTTNRDDMILNEALEIIKRHKKIKRPRNF